MRGAAVRLAEITDSRLESTIARLRELVTACGTRLEERAAELGEPWHLDATRGTEAVSGMIPAFSDPVRALTCQANPWRRFSIAEYLQYSALSRLASCPPAFAIIAYVSLMAGMAAGERSARQP